MVLEVTTNAKDQLARLEPRLGRKKAIVASARKIPTVVWHVLTRETTPSRDRWPVPYSPWRANSACATCHMDRMPLASRASSWTDWE